MKKTACLAYLVLITLISSAFVSKVSDSEKVMVYGIVFSQQCGSNSYTNWYYEYATIDNYNQVQSNLEAKLQTNHPNASKIKVGSSKYDFGSSAKAMCIISWDIKENGCTREWAAAYFGETKGDAYNKAIYEKNKWGGNDVSHSVLVERNW